MAAITITRGFSDVSGVTKPIMSVHIPNSTTFEFDRGAISGSYAEVVINSIAFRAVKTLTVGNVDTYQLNGDMLKYVLGIPVFDPTGTNSLSKTCTVVYNGYNSAGSVIATATDTSFELCNALPIANLENMITFGRSNQTVYYKGLLSYYNVNSNYYESVATTLTGLFTSNGCSFNVVSLDTLDVSYYWLNADGCWDSGTFTEITTETQSKKTSPIALYADQLVNWKGYEFNTINDVDETKVLKTIAKNTEHYQQLYFMTKSPIIMNENGELFELSSPPAPIAACRQNLNFTFSLKRKIHAQSY